MNDKNIFNARLTELDMIMPQDRVADFHKQMENRTVNLLLTEVSKIIEVKKIAAYGHVCYEATIAAIPAQEYLLLKHNEKKLAEEVEHLRHLLEMSQNEVRELRDSVYGVIGADHN